MKKHLLARHSLTLSIVSVVDQLTSSLACSQRQYSSLELHNLLPLGETDGDHGVDEQRVRYQNVIQRGNAGRHPGDERDCENKRLGGSHTGCDDQPD